jgi:hypothetical protein
MVSIALRTTSAVMGSPTPAEVPVELLTGTSTAMVPPCPPQRTTFRLCEDADVTVCNHVGLCVADLDRARRFYVEALGFEPWYELEVPDGGADRLLRLTPPLGITGGVEPEGTEGA